MPLALLVGFVGLLLWNGAAHDEHPLCAIQRAFGGECKPTPGTTGALADRYAQSAGAVAEQTGGGPKAPQGTNRGRHTHGKAKMGNSGHSATVGGSGHCPPYPSDLVTKNGVTLTSEAMASLDRDPSPTVCPM